MQAKVKIKNGTAIIFNIKIKRTFILQWYPCLILCLIPVLSGSHSILLLEIVVEGGGVAESATFAHFVDVQVGLFQQAGGMFEVRLA